MKVLEPVDWKNSAHRSVYNYLVTVNEMEATVRVVTVNGYVTLIEVKIPALKATGILDLGWDVATLCSESEEHHDVPLVVLHQEIGTAKVTVRIERSAVTEVEVNI